LFGKYGIASMMGVTIAPYLTSAWLYPRIIWGGIWGIMTAYAIKVPPAAY